MYQKNVWVNYICKLSVLYNWKRKIIPCSETGYTSYSVRLVETVTYGTLGKDTGRHQGDNFKTLSILQQPDLKFSANFANCIIRKKVETSQLKCSVAARNLHKGHEHGMTN